MYSPNIKRRYFQLLALMGLIKNKTMELFRYVCQLINSDVIIGQCFCEAWAHVTLCCKHGECWFVVISKISCSSLYHTDSPISCCTTFKCIQHFVANCKADCRVPVYKQCTCLRCLTQVCYLVCSLHFKNNFYITAHSDFYKYLGQTDFMLKILSVTQTLWCRISNWWWFKSMREGRAS
jgi:hypothetical protein